MAVFLCKPRLLFLCDFSLKRNSKQFHWADIREEQGKCGVTASRSGRQSNAGTWTVSKGLPMISTISVLRTPQLFPGCPCGFCRSVGLCHHGSSCVWSTWANQGSSFGGAALAARRYQVRCQVTTEQLVTCFSFTLETEARGSLDPRSSRLA